MRKIMLLFFFIPVLLRSQPKVTEGKLFYDITYQNLTAEMKEHEHQLPHDATFYFKNEKCRLEMGAGPFGKNVTITDKTKKETIILLNIYGKKFAMRKSDSEMVEVINSLKTDTARIDIKIELVNDTKKIAGYICHKAFIIKTKNGISNKSECWFTRDLPPYTTEGDEAFKMIDGFLMQYSTFEANINRTLTVKMVMPLPIEDRYFEIPPGYQIVTETELVNVLNVMQQGR